MTYVADSNRYKNMEYKRCGKSGIKLPVVSLGLWHNFGYESNYENARDMILGSFDLGITHFDLANNYGPPPGGAEEMIGRIMKKELQSYRDELIIATKAGYEMWEGPYGDGGSKKYLVSSLDQSLKRMKLDYVDIYYHHRPDPNTPLEESMEALAGIVRQGKALYVGLSNYNSDQLKAASTILKDMGVKPLIHQHRYSMLDRRNDSLTDVLREEGMGSIAFSPLAQGMLTDKYLKDIPEDSRAAGNSRFLTKSAITEDKLSQIRQLNDLASEIGQSLAQMALVWALQKGELSSVLVGASRVDQLEDNVKIVNNLELSNDELEKIDSILA